MFSLNIFDLFIDFKELFLKMNRSDDIRQSCAFQCKKWTLFTFAAIGVVATSVIMGMVGQLVSFFIETGEERVSILSIKLKYI